MAPARENLVVEVVFQIEKDAEGYPKSRNFEALLCKPLDAECSLCVVNSVPFYLRNVAYGDTIETWGQTGRFPVFPIGAFIVQIGSSTCSRGRPTVRGRPPFCGSSRREVACSSEWTKPCDPKGRPLCVHFRMPRSSASFSPLFKYSRQVSLDHRLAHRLKSRPGSASASPQWAAALDHDHDSGWLTSRARTGLPSV